MVGPITIISGERGSKWMKMYPDEGESKGFFDEAQHEKAKDIEALMDDSQNSIFQGKDKGIYDFNNSWPEPACPNFKVCTWSLTIITVGLILLSVYAVFFLFPLQRYPLMLLVHPFWC